MGIVSTVLVFAAILLTRTRTASVVAALSGIFLIVYIFRKRSLVFLLVVLAAVLVIHASNDRVFWRFASLESDRGHRFLLWDYAVQAFRENPVAGCGIGTFDYYLKQRAEKEDQHLARFDHAHNNVLDTAATTGLIGLIALFLFWGKVAWDMWERFRMEADPEWKHIWLAMLLAVVAFHLEGMTECTLKDTEVAIQLYTVTGMFYGLTWFKRPDKKKAP